MNVYLPIRLLGDHTFKVINENIDLTDININYKSLSFNYDNLISYNTIHYYSFDINDVDYKSK